MAAWSGDWIKEQTGTNGAFQGIFDSFSKLHVQYFFRTWWWLLVGEIQ
jgi:hypothetical protein